MGTSLCAPEPLPTRSAFLSFSFSFLFHLVFLLSFSFFRGLFFSLQGRTALNKQRRSLSCILFSLICGASILLFLGFYAPLLFIFHPLLADMRRLFIVGQVFLFVSGIAFFFFLFLFL